ncbi:MAG: imidazole glycerol phosphate synthase subunit HisH [Candidatus Woesearchaeota archaeon]|jgi:imidazole glycerol phosphate synthase glutamine amidotransferase subunit|nr:imidazole glycerol phosphate synthase subunit HisH [Candidatus Woesearchaeota archaeon]|tara:strand:+ start:5303 stop:5881 length:579 start_codon:yes stop_codon:yes gene_type:complete
MIAIIDYGAGNLVSVKNALDYLGVASKITSNAEDIEKAERIILPGVGSFGFMMKSLRKLRLEEPLKKALLKGKPYLGICLGLQALFEESEESPGITGLGIFKGKVVKFEQGKIPQIGWNNIKPRKSFFKEGFVYFVNSYYPIPDDKEIIATKTDYFGDFVSAVQKDNITAMQSHPEKSGEFGLDLIRRWLQC